MSQTLIVVDDLDAWSAYYPSDRVLSFEQYLNGQYDSRGQRVRVINLCQRYRYLSDGYYCSLLAEARQHTVIPSVRVLNDVGKGALYRLHLDAIAPALAKAMKSQDHSSLIRFRSFFGTTLQTEFSELARVLFERFPCPVLEVTLRYRKAWEIQQLKLLSHRKLDDPEETAFAEALDTFSHKVWRQSRSRKPSRYDLAMLVDPQEALPPSNKTALRRFIQAGARLGIDVETITQRDLARLPEFDGLFIRTTTAIDHYSYRFAKKAEAEGLVVIDDPTSILRCTNKVYLADLFRTQNVGTPTTLLLRKGAPEQIEQLENTLGYPMVIKIPDGAFSKGVVKVQDRTTLQTTLKKMFAESALLLAQEYLYTEFDWRIGVLNNKPLYACRYYMVKNHWQIYRHGTARTSSGGFTTLPTFEVPRAVLNTALRATAPIGDGLYGVDIKEIDGKGFVIEVNDNPNIDQGVEDKHLGDALYDTVMADFLRRMEARRG